MSIWGSGNQTQYYLHDTWSTSPSYHPFNLYFNSSTASVSSCDVSPRRFLSAHNSPRVPSPRQPSPLVIDALSNQITPRGRSLSHCDGTTTEPNTPLLKTKDSTNNTLGVTPTKGVTLDEKGRLQRTKSTPPNIDLSKCSTVGIPRLELSGWLCFGNQNSV